MLLFAAPAHSSEEEVPWLALRYPGLVRSALILCLLAGQLVIAAGLQPNPDLPPLPALKVETFGEGARRQLQAAVDAVKANPTDPELNGRAGMLLHAYEQHELATPFYERAQKINPSDFRWNYLLGVVRLVLGQHNDAVVALERAVMARPDNLPARLKWAEALRLAGQPERSAAICRQILDTSPDSALAHYGLAESLLKTGSKAAALEHYSKALKLFPRYGAARYSLALLYRELDQRERAKEQLKLYAKDKTTRPTLPDPVMEEVNRLNTGAIRHLANAVTLEEEGRIEESVAEQQKALEADPNLLQAHVNLIILYGRLGQPAKAEEHYRKGVAIGPLHPEIHYNYGVLLTGEKRWQEAIAAFRRVLEINPFHASAHFNLGALLHEHGELDQAAAEFRAAIESRPGFRRAHFELGRILLHRGDKRKAIEHFSQTLTPEDEQTPKYLYALGASHIRVGNYQDGLRYMREAREKAAAFGQESLLISIERDLKRVEQTVTAK